MGAIPVAFEEQRIDLPATRVRCAGQRSVARGYGDPFVEPLFLEPRDDLF